VKPYRYLLSLLLVVASPPAFAQEKTLVIAGTGGASQDAARSAWYQPFSKETGIRVVEDEYDQKLSQIRAQIEAKNVKWDVATVPILVLYAGCAEGMFEKVEWSKLLNPADFGEPLSPCGVPVVNSSGVLVYDADKIKDGPKTWADFWNVAKWPGKRGLWYGPQETLDLVPATLRDQLPTAHLDTAQPQNTQVYADFWTEHEGELSERFARWVSK
jgi:putative spermidine/putrescine transport system substrate-binding protein